MLRKIPVQSLDTVRQALLRLHATHKSWRKVAALVGVPAGTACSIAKGRVPRKSSVRRALGLPALGLAPACSKCGGVHVTKRCMATNAPPRQRTNWRGIALMCLAAWAVRGE
jgi:hypothetical protein